MHVKLVGAIVGAIASLASAAPPPSAWNVKSVSTSTRCYTGFASTSVPWASSTTWSTHYTPCTTTSTVTSTVTKPPPSTTTTTTKTTTTTTTAPTTSLTSTVTSTSTTTTSTTTTTTSTETDTTTTTSTSTTTVPTSSGFLPIQTTEPGTTYGGAGGADPVAKRASSPRGSYPGGVPSGLRPGTSKSQYQQGVTCYQYQPSSCSTKTVTSTTTVQGTSTGTVTATTTSTVTSTVVPSATVTTTTTSISTTASTITNTATTTTTITSTSVTTTSVYAACATNNLADSLNGNGINGGEQTVGKYTGLDITTSDTAYDCCVAAFTDPNGGAQVWFFTNSSGSCYIYYGSQSSAQSDNQFELDTGSSLYTAGNGYYGEFNS